MECWHLRRWSINYWSYRGLNMVDPLPAKVRGCDGRGRILTDKFDLYQELKLH
jgi:hypothetical protein